MASFFQQITSIGVDPQDHEELKIQKGFLASLAFAMSIGGVVWGSISLYYGLVFQSMFPYAYVVISFFNMLYFASSKNIKPVRFIQVLISLLLPFMFQWSLGGFESSGTIMLWAILSLVASLSFQSIQTSFNWLIVYLMLTIGSGVFDSVAKEYKPEILPSGSVLFVVINLVLISAAVFGLVVFYVSRYKQAEVSLEKEKENLNKSNELLKASMEQMKSSYEETMEAKKQLESKLQDSDFSQIQTQYEKILERQKALLSQYKSKTTSADK